MEEEISQSPRRTELRQKGYSWAGPPKTDVHKWNNSQAKLSIKIAGEIYIGSLSQFISEKRSGTTIGAKGSEGDDGVDEGWEKGSRAGISKSKASVRATGRRETR